MSSSNLSDATSSAQAGSSKDTADHTALGSSLQRSRRPPPGPPRDRKGNIIQRPTYRPLSDLAENSLYILTFVRTSSYEPDSFHWGLYMHNRADIGGMKFHIEGATVAGGWMTEHGTTLGAMKSSKLVAIIRVAQFEASQKERMEGIIREDDGRLNDVGEISCSIWVGRACTRLRDAGLMHFGGDWEEVRREVLDFSNSHWYSGYENQQPRPLGFSRVCGMTS